MGSQSERQSFRQPHDTIPSESKHLTQSERQSFRQPHDTIPSESKHLTYFWGDGVKTYESTIMTGRITIHSPAMTIRVPSGYQGHLGEVATAWNAQDQCWAAVLRGGRAWHVTTATWHGMGEDFRKWWERYGMHPDQDMDKKTCLIYHNLCNMIFMTWFKGPRRFMISVVKRWMQAQGIFLHCSKLPLVYLKLTYAYIYI